VTADSGAIGGDVTHEFMVFADTGESQVFACKCGYAATEERAEGEIEAYPADDEQRELEKVKTPGMKTVEEVTAFLKKNPWQLLKTIVYNSDDEFVAVLMRGDREINEAKLAKTLGSASLELATPEEIEKVTGGPLGFSGPVGLKGVRMVADNSVKNMVNMVTGANEADAHFTNVSLGRDFEPSEYADLVQAIEGDKCKKCGEVLTSWRGIEVGQIFKLGTKYSGAMKAQFLDDKGAEHPFIMGCYGIGVTRTVAASIEQNSDDDGIIWPMSIAPFEVHVLPTNMSDAALVETAETIYQGLLDRGVDVIMDDREERPGGKFKDADLIGVPLRITVGERGMKEGVVEVRLRETGETTKVEIGKAVDLAYEMVNDEKKRYVP
jgi:prolyl-tRNA synthetase